VAVDCELGVGLRGRAKKLSDGEREFHCGLLTLNNSNTIVV
jgi:hypothetical protein